MATARNTPIAAPARSIYSTALRSIGDGFQMRDNCAAMIMAAFFMGAEAAGQDSASSEWARSDFLQSTADQVGGESAEPEDEYQTSLNSAAEATAVPAAAQSSWFADTPPLLVFPRPGLFPIFPTDPGYYSAADCLHGEYRQKPPPFPWGRTSLKPFPFYDVDFRYLDKPDNTYFMWSDVLKRREVGDCWLFSTGGEFRDRYMNEIDSRLTETQNRYEQLRTIVYGSLYYGDSFGVFVQYLDAEQFGHTLPAQAIDRDRSDLSDIFADLKLTEWDNHGLYVRGGRQEILLGSQRLVSNLDWSNTL